MGSGFELMAQARARQRQLGAINRQTGNDFRDLESALLSHKLAKDKEQQIEGNNKKDLPISASLTDESGGNKKESNESSKYNLVPWVVSVTPSVGRFLSPVA